MVVNKVSRLTNHPSISLQNQAGTQLRLQKVELPKNSALKGPVSDLFMANCKEGKWSALFGNLDMFW